MAEATRNPELWNPDQQATLQQPVGRTPLSVVEGAIPQKKQPTQVTSADIVENPDKNANNPRLQIAGIPIRNQGYSPGSVINYLTPPGGELRFLAKPVYDPKEGVHNWYVQGYDADGNPLEAGTISTFNKRGAIITTKGKKKIVVFRPDLVVRR